MMFRPTPLPGVMEVLPAPSRDARGAFTRLWCAEDFAAAGIGFRPVQASRSDNARRHTLRGMHYQAAPRAEAKLVRCISGRVHDVVLDLRPDSPAHRRWIAVTLSAREGNALFIPPGCAHGFMTLTEDAALDYLIDAPHAPELARGVRWDDPAFGIAWPATPAVMSERDRSWPDHG
ncbi:dTDP-4-dehydrorhamnose 3,5-epimerase family protein [Roseomonas sp. PWR1]|uniref:dTDP-4-dehydrorhamnose 3,5-epimerase n=1 Tax=Roseomonas nitratireducens TaxID=2820810 RepID=A0ABS4AW08_9PROT|nr:dTDP-4-dehydrorhamnose 3,5-epimerase family protein [Neoroseomonas nitratireducens]MBP0465550.1 dTDP-4-dehydrorhamnose 3,5-epimerase family protein [Neoroseomonas nitratireducens]